MRRTLTLWVFVRVVRLSVAVERAAVAVRDVCQGIQAAYYAAPFLGIDVPSLTPERPALRVVQGGRR